MRSRAPEPRIDRGGPLPRGARDQRVEIELDDLGQIGDEPVDAEQHSRGRGPAPARPAAEAVEQRLRADLADQVVRVARGDRMEPEGDVLPQLDGDAAGAEREEGA